MLGRQKTRWISLTVGVLLVISLGYYLASPWVVLAQFRVDAQARKEENMSQYIDFPAVRASIKAQLLARLQEEMPNDGDGIHVLGLSLAGAAMEPAVQLLASPRSLIAMMNGENPLPGFSRLDVATPEHTGIVPSEAPAGGKPSAERPHSSHTASAAKTASRPWRLQYQGLNRVVVQCVPQQEGDPYLRMRRHGVFDWKVVDVHLGRLL